MSRSRISTSITRTARRRPCRRAAIKFRSSISFFLREHVEQFLLKGGVVEGGLAPVSEERLLRASCRYLTQASVLRRVEVGGAGGVRIFVFSIRPRREVARRLGRRIPASWLPARRRNSCEFLLLGFAGSLSLFVLLHGFGRRRGNLSSRGVIEDALQRVVVLGRDRIELVVVAAGAGDGESQEAAGEARRRGRPAVRGSRAKKPRPAM